MKTLYPSGILTFLICSLLSFSALNSQNIPVDFESTGNGASWNWTVFENDLNPALEIVSNPDPTGINGSATVAKFTALQAGNPWAGFESMHGTDIGTFTIDSSNMIITIMVWKSVISDVGIKLVRADNWSLGEIKIPNTVVNQWELITFDFSSHLGNVYDQLVVFPDFDLGGRSADHVCYLDNVFGPTSVATGLTPSESIELSLYPNPTNTNCKISSSHPIDELKVYNMIGELVFENQMPDTNPILDISDLPSGMYIVQASALGQTFSKKLIKN